MQISSQVDWFDAIRNQNYEAIYDADGVFHGSRDAAGETGLMKAAKFNDIKLAKMLAPVEAGIVNNEGHNALMIAALNNNSQICAMLVEIPSERDHRLGYGEDALILASSVGALKTVAVLLPYMEKNKDIKNRTCLTYAACNGKLNVVNYLIRYKQEITDMEAKAALVAAAGNSHADCVHALTIYIKDGKINYLTNVQTDEDDMDRDYYHYDDILPQTDLGIQGLQDSNIYNVRPAELHITQRMNSQAPEAPPHNDSSATPHQEKLEFVPEPGVVSALQVSGYIEPSLESSPNISIINKQSPGKTKEKVSVKTPREKHPKTPTTKPTKTSKARTPTTTLRVDNSQLTSNTETRSAASERTLTSSTLYPNAYNTSNLNRNLNRSLTQSGVQRSGVQSMSPQRTNYIPPGQSTFMTSSTRPRNISPTAATRSSYVDDAQYSLYEAINKASQKKLVTPPQEVHPRSLNADILTADPRLQEAMVARYYEDVSPPPRQPGASAATMAALNKSNIKAIRSNTNNRFAEVNPMTGTFYGPSTTAEGYNPTESSLTASILHPVSARDVNLVNRNRTASRAKSGSRNPRSKSNAMRYEDFNDQVESVSRLQTPTMSMRSSTVRLRDEVDYRPTYVDTRLMTSADRYEDNLSLNPSHTSMPIGPLSRHIQKNDITILEIPDFELDPSYTDLMKGIYNGDKKAIKQNMKSQANRCSDNHMTALMVAARIGDIANTKLLIKAGETGKRTSEGWTALMIAAFHNSVEAVKLLIEHEARNVTNDGWTALMIAIKFNAVGCVELLAEHEAGIQDNSKVSAMMIAAYMGKAGIIPLLIKNEARLCDSYGRTAMMYATLNNEVECVEKLVYAENNVQDPEGRTALMMAAQLGLNDIVLVLQKEEAGKRANMGRTALMFAARNCNLIGVQVLAGLECGLQDAEGWSAMMMAVLDNQAEIVKSLKEYEANLKTNKGFTALMFAARFGFDECVEILAPVEAGEQTPTGWSALMAAVSNNNLTSARLLVPYEVMLQDSKKNTALMLACKKNNNEMIKLLRQAQESVRNVRNSARK